MGKRMRPHTLTVPKPLIPVGGKPIVQRLVEDITKVCGEKVDEIAFIIGPTFGKEVEANLIDIAKQEDFVYSINSTDSEHCVNCVFCFENMTTSLSKLPCDHIFHKECFNNYLYFSHNTNPHKKVSCVICRKQIS